MSEENPGLMQLEPARRVGAPAALKQTVTIGDTTVLIDEVVGWRISHVFGDDERATTVFFRSTGRIEVEGDHRATLDAAVNDPRRWLSNSLDQAVE